MQEDASDSESVFRYFLRDDALISMLCADYADTTQHLDKNLTCDRLTFYWNLLEINYLSIFIAYA